MTSVPTSPIDIVDFRLVFEATPHPYLLLAPDAPHFTILGVNDAYLNATRTVRDAVLGRGLFEVFPDNPDDLSVSGVSDLRISLERVLRDRSADVMGVQKYDIPIPEDPSRFEVRYWTPVNAPVIDPDGQIRYLLHRAEDVTAVMLAREAAQSAAAQGSDPSGRLEAEVFQAEAQLKTANRELKAVTGQLVEANTSLKELDRAKTRFFANVSHEFRTPLTLLLGPLDDLLDGASGGGLSDDERALLETARRNALRLSRLVDTLLEVTRLEAGRTHATFTPQDLSALTADLASGFRSACERAGLTLTVDCPPLPQPVYVDIEMWEKVVLNLLSNAFKFTHDGGIEVRARPTIDGRGATITVRDTGVGVPAHELPRLFERFHRVEGAHGRSFEGTGIGLSLVRELVQLHGGQASAESVLGEGSTFTVSLPFGQAHLPSDQVHAVAAVPASLGRGAAEALTWLGDDPPTRDVNAVTPPAADGGRIVIADDNNDMRAYIARLLRAAGHEVIAETADGASALDAIRDGQPDLVLSDVMMPVMDGFALLRSLRGDPVLGGVPVILLSANADEAARAEGLAAGADDYLVKPFGARELAARVEGAIRMTRLRRTLEAQLRQSQKMEAVGQLTGGIAHDFNNLLTAVIGGLDMIVRKPDDEQRTRRVAENALAAARRGAKLTGQLLAFSRSQRLDIRPLDLTALLAGMDDLLTRSVGPAIAVKVAVDPDARSAFADANQLELAILNLAVNARDAMPDGGRLTITARRQTLEAGELAAGDYVVLSVADTGAGMPADVVVRAFEPFYSTKGAGKGSGLGLSQVYAMARKGGGTARIAASGDDGAVVEILLPAAMDQAAADSASQAAGVADDQAEPAHGRAAKILVIDDDSEVRELFVEGLRGYGYLVSEAADGFGGLRLLDAEAPDAMLVDFAMPGMNGAEVARRARELRPALPILFATGFADSDALARVSNTVVLRKPLAIADLARAISAALAPAV